MPGQVERVVDDLRKFYGRSSEPTVTKPFEQVLWDNVAYLVHDERRARAFALLREQIGTSHEAILGAPQAKLLGVTGHGILAETFAAKLACPPGVRYCRRRVGIESKRPIPVDVSK